MGQALGRSRLLELLGKLGANRHLEAVGAVGGASDLVGGHQAFTQLGVVVLGAAPGEAPLAVVAEKDWYDWVLNQAGGALMLG